MSELFFLEREPYSLAPRLFRLQPAGDAQDRENLASYLKRMAKMHRMSPRGFVEEYVSAPESSEDRVALQRDWLYRNAQDLIGASDRAGELADWFGRNAGVTGLRNCTLVNLSRFASGQKLVTRASRACLECFADDCRMGRPMFERLQWRLEAVTACDRHRCALVTPQCQDPRAFVRWMLPNLPGICAQCGSIALTCSASSGGGKASETDIWVAQQCRRLIEALPGLADADPVRMKQNLRWHWLARDGIVSAAKAIGMVQSSVSAWLNKPRAKCSLFRLIDIALTQQLDLVAMLKGEIVSCASPSDRGPRTRKRVLLKVNHAAIRLRLQAALEAGETAAQVAREMKVSLFTLSLHGDLYRQVSDQARAARDRKSTERRRIAVQEAEDVIVRLLRKGIAPSLRNAAIESGKKWMPSLLRSAALASIRIRLNHVGVKPPPRSGTYSTELRQMLDESAKRIREQLS